ncbi:GNAT family N-acetyltransferase [Mucilaginibacter sp. HD30]
MNLTRVKRTTSDDPDFKALVKELDKDLRIINGEVMDVYDQHNIIEAIETVIIIYLDNEPVACGCFKQYAGDTIEIKRMYVKPHARGMGLSKTTLLQLEEWAKELGFTCSLLETGARQTEALGLYNKVGYVQIPKYEPYVDLPDSICFRKYLQAIATPQY